MRINYYFFISKRKSNQFLKVRFLSTRLCLYRDIINNYNPNNYYRKKMSIDFVDENCEIFFNIFFNVF